MSLIDAIWGIFGGREISLTEKSSWTGLNNMRDPKFLSQAQDTVWADPRWKAIKNDDGTQTTHCNQASLAVANGVGCHEFDPPAKGEPYTADQLYNFFQREASNFLEKDMDDCIALVNKGALIFAVAPSWILQEKHGHIVSLTPGDGSWSQKLAKKVPLCLNVSTIDLSARCIGINWAFPLHRAIPRFFVWKASL